ncbi:MAG: flagellar hook protein FlgE [Gammaproteobacteria bacterium]
MTFNTALSGIQAANDFLNVASNNIANSSTTGFKLSRAEFVDVVPASALGTASNVVGTGVRLSNISQQFTQGNISFTENNLDLAISGQGFFVLNDNGTSVYSRAGAFGVDRNGFIVNSDNQRLTGFQADSDGNISGATGDIAVSTANLSPQATSTASITANLDSRDAAPVAAWVGTPTFGGAPPAPNTYNDATSVTIFDSLGNSHVLTTYYIKTSTANQWETRFQIDGVDVDASPTATPFTQVFNADGTFNAGSSEAITLSWPPLDSAGNPNGATTPQAVSIDLSASTQFGSAFSVQALTQNGFTTGRLNNIEIGDTGILFGRYTNGESLALGQIVLANFSNVQGLQPLGDSVWGETFNSGQPLIGEPGTGSLGLIQSGAREESNVDLTAALVDLITGQRNFQANAQVIRTLDTVTQSIINIR